MLAISKLKQTCLLAGFASMVAIAACDRGDYDVSDTGTTTTIAGGDVVIGGLRNFPANDAGVVDLVVAIDEAEIEAAELARTKAQNAQVKSFANEMLNAHKEDMRKVEELSNQAGIHHSGMSATMSGTSRMDTLHKMDTTLGMAKRDTGVTGSVFGGKAWESDSSAIDMLQSSHARTMERLRGLSGTEFDRAYIDSQVSAHEQAIEILEHLSTTTQNAELRRHLSATVPIVRQHHDRARELQRSFGGKSMTQTGDTIGRTT